MDSSKFNSKNYPDTALRNVFSGTAKEKRVRKRSRMARQTRLEYGETLYIRRSWR